MNKFNYVLYNIVGTVLCLTIILAPIGVIILELADIIKLMSDKK